MLPNAANLPAMVRNAKARSAAKSGGSQKILVLHGPNLNLLGIREPDLYGGTTLTEINQRLKVMARAAGASIECVQSNHEGELVDRVQAAGTAGVSFIVINAAAYTHTSIALRDALAAVDIPFVEVHISNVFAREDFRHRSYLADLAVGVVCGLGAQGYEFALGFALNQR
jgi:3-dehydroquinate dehydratase II